MASKPPAWAVLHDGLGSPQRGGEEPSGGSDQPLADAWRRGVAGLICWSHLHEPERTWVKVRTLDAGATEAEMKAVSRELLDEPKGCIESVRALNRDGWPAIAISEHLLAKGV